MPPKQRVFSDAERTQIEALKRKGIKVRTNVSAASLRQMAKVMEAAAPEEDRRQLMERSSPGKRREFASGEDNRSKRRSVSQAPPPQDETPAMAAERLQFDEARQRVADMEDMLRQRNMELQGMQARAQQDFAQAQALQQQIQQQEQQFAAQRRQHAMEGLQARARMGVQNEDAVEREQELLDRTDRGADETARLQGLLQQTEARLADARAQQQPMNDHVNYLRGELKSVSDNMQYERGVHQQALQALASGEVTTMGQMGAAAPEPEQPPDVPSLPPMDADAMDVEGVAESKSTEPPSEVKGVDPSAEGALPPELPPDVPSLPPEKMDVVDPLEKQRAKLEKDAEAHLRKREQEIQQEAKAKIEEARQQEQQRADEKVKKAQQAAMFGEMKQYRDAAAKVKLQEAAASKAQEALQQGQAQAEEKVKKAQQAALKGELKHYRDAANKVGTMQGQINELNAQLGEVPSPATTTEMGTAMEGDEARARPEIKYDDLEAGYGVPKKPGSKLTLPLDEGGEAQEEKRFEDEEEASLPESVTKFLANSPDYSDDPMGFLSAFAHVTKRMMKNSLPYLRDEVAIAGYKIAKAMLRDIAMSKHSPMTTETVDRIGERWNRFEDAVSALGSPKQILDLMGKVGSAMKAVVSDPATLSMAMQGAPGEHFTSNRFRYDGVPQNPYVTDADLGRVYSKTLFMGLASAGVTHFGGLNVHSSLSSDADVGAAYKNVPPPQAIGEGTQYQARGPLDLSANARDAGQAAVGGLALGTAGLAAAGPVGALIGGTLGAAAPYMKGQGDQGKITGSIDDVDHVYGGSARNMQQFMTAGLMGKGGERDKSYQAFTYDQLKRLNEPDVDPTAPTPRPTPKPTSKFGLADVLASPFLGNMEEVAKQGTKEFVDRPDSTKPAYVPPAPAPTDKPTPQPVPKPTRAPPTAALAKAQKAAALAAQAPAPAPALGEMPTLRKEVLAYMEAGHSSEEAKAFARQRRSESLAVEQATEGGGRRLLAADDTEEELDAFIDNYMKSRGKLLSALV